MILEILIHLLSLILFFFIFVVPFDLILHALIRLRVKDDDS